jgi:hypothetical protein
MEPILHLDRPARVAASAWSRLASAGQSWIEGSSLLPGSAETGPFLPSSPDDAFQKGWTQVSNPVNLTVRTPP